MVTGNRTDQQIETYSLQEELKKKKKDILPEPEGYIFDYETNEFVPASADEVAQRETFYQEHPYVGTPGTPGKITLPQYESQLSTLTKSLYPEKFQPGTSYGYKPEELPPLVLKQARENAIENIQTFAEDLNQRGTLQDRQAMLSLLGVQPEDVDQLLGTNREQQAEQLTKQVLPGQDINTIIDNPQDFITKMQTEGDTEEKRQLLTTYGFTPDEIEQIIGVRQKVMNVNGVRKLVNIKADGSVTDLTGANVGIYDAATETITQHKPVPTTDQFVEEYFKEKGWDSDRSKLVKNLATPEDYKTLKEYDQRLIEASDKYKELYGVTNWLRSGLAKLVSTIASSFWSKKYIQPTPEEPTGLEKGFAAIDIAVFLPFGIIFKAGKLVPKAWNAAKAVDKAAMVKAAGLTDDVAKKAATELTEQEVKALSKQAAKIPTEAIPKAEAGIQGNEQAIASFTEKVGKKPEFYTPEVKVRMPTFNQLITNTYNTEMKGNVKNVHIGKVDGKPAWADGFMLEIKPVPEKLKATKGYRPVAKGVEGKSRDFTSLVPEYGAEAKEATPILRVPSDPTKHIGTTFNMDRTFLISADGDVYSAIDTKYFNYFKANYPDAKFIVKDAKSPIVIQSKGKTVGVVMPIFQEDSTYNAVLELAGKRTIAPSKVMVKGADGVYRTPSEMAKPEVPAVEPKPVTPIPEAKVTTTPSPSLAGQGIEAAGVKGVPPVASEGAIPPVKPPKPPVAEGVTPEPSEPVINKLIDVLNEQKGLRKSTTATQKAALAPKFKGIEALRQTPEGEATVSKIGATLKGELGHEVNPSYAFTQLEKDELYNNITQSVLKDSEIFPAQKALMRLLDPDKFAMRFPDEIADMPLRNFEIKYFEKVWGKDVAKQLATDSKLFRVTSTLNDAFWELRYNSLLSGKAQIRNMVSNIIRTMTNPIESLASVVGELPLRLIPGYKPARFAGEAVQETIGALGGIRGGVKEALHTLATGERYAEGLAKYELPERVFTGKLGKILNIPSIGMDAGDVLFRKPLTQSNIYKLAYRQASQEGLKGAKFVERLVELKANPTPEMMLAARDATNSSLFRENTKLSGLIIKLRDYKIPGTGFQPFREAAMFVRVPINVAAYGLARSPVGAMNPKLWANIAAKDPKAADQIGRVMLGSAVAAVFYTYAAEGNLTGAPPKSEAERNLWTLQGKIPFAAKIGNKWVQYNQIPLIGTTLFEMAQVFDAIKDEDKSAPEKVAKLAYDLAHFFTEQTPLAGMSNFLNAMTDPERYAEQWVENYVPSLIPYSAALRVSAQAIDEIVRKPKSVGEAIMAAMPWLSEQVPPKLDITGEEVKRTTPWWSPLNVGLDKETVLTKELDRLNVNIGMAGTSIVGTKLSDEEQLKYQELTGKTINKDVSALMLLPDYWKADDATRTEMLNKAVTGARNYAREKMQEQIWSSGTTEERLTTLQTALSKADSQLGKVISETPTLSGGPPQIYDLKTELDSSYRTLFKNISQESLKGVKLPPTAGSWFAKEKAKQSSSVLPNKALIDIQPGKEDKTTFEDYYLQWQKRGQITDERELEKFDKDYPNANLGNFTRRQLDLLRTYNKFDDAGRKTFLEGLSESDKKAITANAYTDWLKANPKDNAQLAIWGDAKILTQEAYTEFKKLVGSLDVVDSVIPKLTMPPEGSIDNYFKYQDMVAEGKNASWEAQLMLAKDTKLREFLGLKQSDTPIASLELKVKNAETQRKYDELTDKEARDKFRAANPKWVDDLRRIEAIESNGEAVAEKYVEYGKKVDEFGASSAEAKLFRVDSPDLEKWGTERKDGWEPIDKTKIPIWRIDAQFRKEDAAYSALKDDKARTDYLAKNSLYRIARRQREAIQKGVDAVQYTTYYELPDKGYRRERFLKENPDFATSMNLKVPEKVPSEMYDTLLEKPNPTPQDKLAMDAYKLYVPDKMVGNYVAYRTLLKGEYEDDWYLQEHPDFYRDVYLGILKNERKDYRKVPSRQVYAKYQQYQGIFGEVARDNFRDSNLDLDAWLVTKFGYVPIAEKKRRESLTPTEKGKEKAWQQGEDWKRKLKEIEGLLAGVK